MFDSTLTASQIEQKLKNSLWTLTFKNSTYFHTVDPFSRTHVECACKLANYQEVRSSCQAVLDQGLLSLVQLGNQLQLAKLSCMETFNQAEGWPSP